jgi:hypothetical protein
VFSKVETRVKIFSFSMLSGTHQYPSVFNLHILAHFGGNVFVAQIKLLHTQFYYFSKQFEKFCSFAFSN